MLVLHYSCVSTYDRALTQTDDIDYPDKKAERRAFDAPVHEKVGPPATTTDDFVDEFNDFDTPIYETYQDAETKILVIPDRDDHQDFDEYIGAEVLLPFGDRLKTGKRSKSERETMMVILRGSHTQQSTF